MNSPDTSTRLTVIDYLPAFQNLYLDRLAREESVLERVAYPEIEEHKALHKDYAAEVESLVDSSIY